METVNRFMLQELFQDMEILDNFLCLLYNSKKSSSKLFGVGIAKLNSVKPFIEQKKLIT